MIEGGCQCGAVRYRVSAADLKVYACHCRECQRQSGSAFALSAPVRSADFALTGDVGVWSRGTASGARTACSFCAACGTRIHHQSSAAPEWLTLKPGTLDDTSGLFARAHIWTAHRQPWVILDPAVEAFETQPADLPAWRRRFVEAG
ncbi:GFA family protein [Glacieibacterium frigidum]|uniref:GFA family protein n=1 Tax=Glacieibacterium frigidum TaxID=2593303 RepID=A0A552UJ19_9SPHN|nr:GFA family protein [Glacieibacterium frigidum]TRW18228.1 GFA family protein [Glacieibacterium frigidum]